MNLKKEATLQHCLREQTQANLESDSSRSKLENPHSSISVENVKKNEQSVQVRNFGNLNQKVNHIEF